MRLIPIVAMIVALAQSGTGSGQIPAPPVDSSAPADVAKDFSLRPKQSRVMQDIPRCTRKLGSIAIVAPDKQWWRDYNLGDPEAMLRALIQQSGCFTIVNRGRAMQSRSRERDIGHSGGLQSGSNLGKGQVRAPDYYLEPNIVGANANAGNVGGALGGLFGSRGVGGIAGGISVKKKEANVTLSIVNGRTTEEEALTEGYARKSDARFGAGALSGASLAAVGGNGYQNTEMGQIIVSAYVDAYTKLVTQLAAGSPNSLVGQGSTPDAPFLPWPPPQPSSMGEVSLNFRKSGNLGQFDDQIRAHLKTRGYEQLHYFSVPGGFSLTTNLERIDADGRPGNERWSSKKLPSAGGFFQYISDLLTGTEGRFRLFAFVVSDQEPMPAAFEAKQMDIDRWKTSGRPFLSAQMRRARASSSTRVWLLVYEFEASNSKGRSLVAPDDGGLPFGLHTRFLRLR